MKTHVSHEGYPLCGNSTYTAAHNSADCQLCLRRVVEMLDILYQAATGQDVREKASVLLKKMQYIRPTGEDQAV
jgi:hypothetical protein